MVKIFIDTDKDPAIEFEGEVDQKECLTILDILNQMQQKFLQHLEIQILVEQAILLQRVMIETGADPDKIKNILKREDEA